MRTESEMLDLILRTAKVIQADSVALSGSRTNPNAPKDEFQDYDVVYIVDDLAAIVTDLAWLEAFGKRIIEQHNILDHRRLYLMLFEDGNRIDLTLCPKEHIKEWVDSEADFTVLDDPQDSFSPIHLLPNVIGQNQRVQMILQNRAMNSGGFQPMLSRGFSVSNLCMRWIISMVSVRKNC